MPYEMMKVLEITEIEKTVRSTGLIVIGKIFAFPINFFTNIIIVRLLGAQTYGAFVLAGVVINVGRILSTGGLRRGVLRFVSFYRGQGRPERVIETIVSATFIVSVISTLVTIFLYFLAKPIAIGIFHNRGLVIVIQILAFSLPFSAVAAIWLGTIQGFKEIGDLVLVGIFSSLIYLGFIGILFLLGWSLVGFLVVCVLNAAMSCLLAFFFLKKNDLTWEKARFFCFNRELVNFSLPLLLVNFVNLFLYRTDMLMLGYFKTVSDVGIYSVAFRISLIILFPLNAFRPIFGPMISEFFGRNEVRKAEELFKMATKWSLSLTMPVFLFIVLYPRHVLSIFGPHFVVGTSVTVILGLVQFINCSVGPTGGMITMSGHPKINMMNSIMLLCCNIVLNYLLIPRYGLLGAATATGISIVAVNMIRIVEVYSLLKFHLYDTSFIKPLLAGVISFVVIFASKNILGETRTSVVILEALGLIALYGAIIYLLKLDEGDRMVINLVFKRLKNLVSPENIKEGAL